MYYSKIKIFLLYFRLHTKQTNYETIKFIVVILCNNNIFANKLSESQDLL
jgi:hypothetical protein